MQAKIFEDALFKKLKDLKPTSKANISNHDPIYSLTGIKYNFQDSSSWLRIVNDLFVMNIWILRRKSEEMSLTSDQKHLIL